MVIAPTVCVDTRIVAYDTSVAFTALAEPVRLQEAVSRL